MANAVTKVAMLEPTIPCVISMSPYGRSIWHGQRYAAENFQNGNILQPVRAT
jgi:hypothetical protein